MQMMLVWRLETILFTSGSKKNNKMYLDSLDLDIDSKSILSSHIILSIINSLA